MNWRSIQSNTTKAFSWLNNSQKPESTFSSRTMMASLMWSVSMIEFLSTRILCSRFGNWIIGGLGKLYSLKHWLKNWEDIRILLDQILSHLSRTSPTLLGSIIIWPKILRNFYHPLFQRENKAMLRLLLKPRTINRWKTLAFWVTLPPIKSCISTKNQDSRKMKPSTLLLLMEHLRVNGQETWAILIRILPKNSINTNLTSI